MAERWRMCAWKIESRVGHHTAPTQRNARHSERAQLSGLDMRERGRDSAEHNLHLTVIRSVGAGPEPRYGAGCWLAGAERRGRTALLTRCRARLHYAPLRTISQALQGPKR